MIVHQPTSAASRPLGQKRCAVILDIDGTLLESNRVDGELFVEAIERVLGPVRFRETWEAYGNVSDSGILAEVLRDNGLQDDGTLSRAVKQCFLESLDKHIRAQGPFEEIRGARNFVACLEAAPDCAWAYATGSWAASAELKLRSAGFPFDGVPLASSDDARERCRIMEIALQRLGGTFEDAVYFGDGQWDRKAAGSLGWRFVPVGTALSGLMDFGEMVAFLAADRAKGITGQLFTVDAGLDAHA